MGPHLHIMKYSEGLSGMPKRQYNMFHPIKGSEIMKVDYYSVHLCYLTYYQRVWRKENWKKYNLEGCDLWKLDKDIEHMTPKEITDTFKRKPDGKL